MVDVCLTFNCLCKFLSYIQMGFRPQAEFTERKCLLERNITIILALYAAKSSNPLLNSVVLTFQRHALKRKLMLYVS